mgnify:CR=1 FL=1
MQSQAGESGQQKQRALGQAISQHYKDVFQLAQKQRDELDQSIPIIATGHLTAMGVTTSESVRDIYIGTLEAFPSRAFPPADYIALGHIHRPQKVTKSDHIRYSGSPIALSFDEAKTEKSIVIAEFTQGELTQTEICPVPCFQPLAMVKTNLENLADDISAVVWDKASALKNQLNTDSTDKLWLDIEIESAEYLQDLTARIEQIVKELPVEVLLVRRSKKSREQMPSHEKKITLSELSVQEVFDARLAQEQWQSDDQLQRKTRLNSLYLSIAEQTQLANSDNEAEQK